MKIDAEVCNFQVYQDSKGLLKELNVTRYGNSMYLVYSVHIFIHLNNCKLI